MLLSNFDSSIISQATCELPSYGISLGILTEFEVDTMDVWLLEIGRIGDWIARYSYVETAKTIYGDFFTIKKVITDYIYQLCKY